MDFDATV